MKNKTYEGSQSRKVLSAMITNDTVCGRVAGQWKREGLFADKVSNIIGGWCVKYYEKYGRAPQKEIQPIFERWADKNKIKDKSTTELVENFLLELSAEYESEEIGSIEFLLDRAGEVFNKERVAKALAEASWELDQGRTERAREILSLGVEQVELGEGQLVKLGEDYEVWREAFDREENEQLIKYRGKANDFIGSAMTRDSFVAFMGPDKSGKSMYLLDAAYRGVRNRKRVAYFEVGDMSQSQVVMRIAQRVCRVPRYPGKANVPTEIDEVTKKITWAKQFFKEVLTPQKAFKQFKRFCGNRDLFRLSCYPNSSVDIITISSIVKSWAKQGWVADIVVVDYADILAAPPGATDSLDEIDKNWKLFRRLSQEMHCLVLTATQSSAAAYVEKKLLGRKHFSGSKKKLAHVNGMLGINVSEDDKRRGISKLNWVVKRDGFYTENQYVSMVGCWDICSPCLLSK